MDHETHHSHHPACGENNNAAHRHPDHSRGHGRHHHHLPSQNGNLDSRFIIGIVLNVLFVVAEVVFGLISDSMALLTDAAHNLSDVLGLVLAFWAATLARRAPTQTRTYGFRKATILSALANATLIMVAVGGIAWEAALRIADPPPVEGRIMMLVAAVGVVINTLSALLFLKGRHEDINIRAAFLHLAADAAVSVGVVIAGFAIYWSGQLWIDPVVSLGISAVIILGTWSLLKSSLDLALDAVPAHIDVQEVKAFLLEQEGVHNIHDLHVWAMSATETALTAHICSKENWSSFRIRTISRELEERFLTHHVTLQVEPVDGCPDPCPQSATNAV